MSIADQLLAAILVHGIPVLFCIVVIAAVGAPIPASLILVAAGSFARQGELSLLPVILSAVLAAVLGDQIGYWVARWGGHRVVARLSRRFGGEIKIKKAEAVAKKWGGPGIFFSRWLITELGPWLNITSGIAGYSWRHFILWDVLGEALWVVLYVMLGYVFSDRVQFITEILGNLAWALLGLIIAIMLGWKLLRYLRPVKTESRI